jgi:hypothetical protein
MRDKWPCQVQARVRRAHPGQSVDPVERLAVEPTHTAVAHTEPQGIPLVPIDGPHRVAGQPVLNSEVRQRLAIEAPRAVVACSKPDVAGSVLCNREYPAERIARLGAACDL